MKTSITLTIGLLFSLFCYSQDQVINGILKMNGYITLQGTTNPGPFGEYGRKLYFGYPYENSDDIWLARFNVSSDVSELRLNLGDYSDDRFVIQNDHSAYLFTVHTAGYITLGDIKNPPIKITKQGQIYSKSLDVNGTIRAKEVKIEATGWSDFVFDKNYQLPTLQAVEQHINDKGHLPDIPSEKEVIENGIDVAEMQTKLLQKIEELTLYVIDQNKKIEKLESENREIKEQLKRN